MEKLLSRFEGTDYLIEAKWQKEPVAARDLDGMAGKLSRKLDNIFYELIYNKPFQPTAQRPRGFVSAELSACWTCH